ncbi:NAD-dependent epimerase/dehydratase family protein [Roseomonas xinghualingensis]|uniref:NAD-dependent epimerase/dehydratase family protein n=1 Tax=Roseomonas xinghualingensis TaxID=2986475 RepID=UPI0021F1285B|nr:NAD-dependent epimerase/dehydratase family protein [Roseomonas sp. SXEYE001]MCV4209800.1 NAD-dependent epimerase/dehydratase family protein [Roseomonas sp. SXEYE001]
MAKSDTAAVPVKGSKLMVIGGASLVGSATVDEMLARGAAEVTIFDNLSFGGRPNIAHLEGNPKVKMVQGDILKLHQLLRAAENMDGVVHLAAFMTLNFDRDPWGGIDVNIRGVQNVLEACRANKVRKLVFASSNAVYGYGPGVKGDLVENTPFHAAGAPPAAILYGSSKIMGEQLCRDAHRKWGQDYVILRYSTVYGERQHYRAANALYIVETHDAIKRGERPKVIGDGSETKHFVYVGDLACANCMALEAATTDVAVNTSGPAPITTLELVNLVAELSGRPELKAELVEPDPTKVRLTSGGAFEIVHRAAKDAIGWEPQVSMREGLSRLLAWRDASLKQAAE